MSDSYIGFFEGMKRRKVVASSFVSEPENDLSGFCEQPSQMDSSIDSTYSAFANNLGRAGASSPIIQQHEGRALRLGELMELSLSDDDELWEEYDQIQKAEFNSEMKWMSVGEYDRMLEGQSTILAEEGQKAMRKRNWRLVESGNERDGGKSDWCLGQMVEGDVTMVSEQPLDTSVQAENVALNSRSTGSLRNRQIPNQRIIRKDLEQNRAKTAGKKQFPCSGCSKLFSSKQHATNHKFTHMEKEELDNLGVFYEECTTCNKIFLNKGNFNRHQLIHSGIKNHICGVCSMAFTRKEHLVTHANVHLNPREKQKLKSGWKNVCYFCDHKFKSPRDLFRHFQIHSKERAFRCKLCKQTFNRPSSLTSHKKMVHEKRRQFLCENCGKSFATKQNLKQHSAVHSGARPFPCPQCDKTFTRNLHLNTHLKSAHLGLKFQCLKCKNVFAFSSGLNRHLKKAHK